MAKGSFTLDYHDAPAMPNKPGHYLVWLELDRPTVLWWSRHSVDWRRGATLVHPKRFAGPLPVREVSND